MNKGRCLILIFLIACVCFLGFFLGAISFNKRNNEDYKSVDKIVVDAIRNSFDNINVRPNDGEISDLRLVCQDNMRYLYAFHYENYGEYEELDNTNEFAIEMIIDKESDFYYVESLEMYFNRYDNKCLNLFE